MRSQRLGSWGTVDADVQVWKDRPLEEVYPIVYFDALHSKVRDNGQVATVAMPPPQSPGTSWTLAPSSTTNASQPRHESSSAFRTTEEKKGDSLGHRFAVDIFFATTFLRAVLP